MYELKAEYIVDAQGNKTKVLLVYDDYKKLIEMIEDTEDSKIIAGVAKEPELPWSEYKRKEKLYKVLLKRSADKEIVIARILHRQVKLDKAIIERANYWKINAKAS